MYYHNKALHQAVTRKKPGVNQKARALRDMKAAKDREEQLHDQTRQKDIQGTPQTRMGLWEEHLKSPVADLAKALECLEAAFGCLNVWFIGRFVEAYVLHDSRQCCWCKEPAEIVGRALLGRDVDPWDVVGLHTPASTWNVLKEYGPYGDLFFFFFKKEQLVLRKMDFGHCIPVETIKTCALCGLHMVAEEDMWRYECPKNPDWNSDVGVWTRSEGTSSSEMYEHNVESLALEVIGQNWSGEMVSLFLEDWELARVALSCHLAPDLLCQEMQESCQGGPLSQCTEASQHGEECGGTTWSGELQNFDRRLGRRR